jgi:hypothetical protein
MVRKDRKDPRDLLEPTALKDRKDLKVPQEPKGRKGRKASLATTELVLAVPQIMATVPLLLHIPTVPASLLPTLQAHKGQKVLKVLKDPQVH